METVQKSNVPIMIIGTFIAFAMFIGYIVYQSFQVDVNLVRDDYYQQSTKHDQHLAEVKRSEDAMVRLYFDRTNALVKLEVPSDFNDVQGEIHFYRPSDAKLDFKVPITLKESMQILSTEAIAEGKWEIKAVFSHNGEQYFKESTFIK